MSRSDWQTKGGKIEIPNGWFVYKVDLDANPPYAIIIEDHDAGGEEKKIKIPKSLAYYLTTHFCGSASMRKSIEEQTRKNIGHTIKKELGL